MYFKFISPEKPRNYLTENGNFSPLTPKVLMKKMQRLRNPVAGNKDEELKFGPGPETSSGYGVYFIGTDLNFKSTPNETNQLKLEFPTDFMETKSPEQFIKFAESVLEVCQVQWGTGGYAFQSVFLGSSDNDDEELVAQLAMRYRGFDLDMIDRYDMKGFIQNVSWLNIMGSSLIKKFGGIKKLSSGLPKSNILKINENGVLIVTSNIPVAGDIESQASELKPLKELAKFLKPLRIPFEDIFILKDDFAEQWLTRFD